MKVNICGMLYDVVEEEDIFHFGEKRFGFIDYMQTKIHINKDMTVENKKETLCHEMVHGILNHLGYNDYNDDEQFVQALGNAIYQSFSIVDKEKEE